MTTSDAVSRIDGAKVVSSAGIGGVVGFLGSVASAVQQFAQNSIVAGQQAAANHLTNVVAPSIRGEAAHGVAESATIEAVQKVVSAGTKSISEIVSSAQKTLTAWTVGLTVGLPAAENAANEAASRQAEEQRRKEEEEKNKTR